MSRSLWRCRNLDCPVAHGAVLGWITKCGGLVLAPPVQTFTAYLDTRRAIVACPECGAVREFRGIAVFSPYLAGGSY
jgi:hypothetical protein